MQTILISGGANGADSLFEECAKFKGHQCIIYKAGVIESIAHKESYDKFLIYLNLYLKRKYPTDNEYINDLLRRDVLIGMHADTVFAVGTLDADSKIRGGTAWTSYTFMTKYKFGIIPFYFFDQELAVWYQVHLKDGNVIFEQLKESPKIVGCSRYGGIGTRNLNQNGIDAIRGLYK